MRRPAVLAMVLALAACGSPEPTASEAPPPKTAHGVGTIIGVDPQNGTLTLQHGPIPDVGWPAMRMAFRAPPEAIAAAKVGDRVAFDLRFGPGGAEITQIHQP